MFFLLSDRLLLAHRSEGGQLRFLCLPRLEEVQLLWMEGGASPTGFYLRLTPRSVAPSYSATFSSGTNPGLGFHQAMTDWERESLHAFVAHDKQLAQLFCSTLQDAQARLRSKQGRCVTLHRYFQGQHIYTHIYSGKEYVRTPLKSQLALLYLGGEEDVEELRAEDHEGRAGEWKLPDTGGPPLLGCIQEASSHRFR